MTTSASPYSFTATSASPAVFTAVGSSHANGTPVMLFINHCCEPNVGFARASHPGLQRIFARRCSEALEWDTGHSPFLSHPALVAQMLAEIAEQAGG